MMQARNPAERAGQLTAAFCPGGEFGRIEAVTAAATPEVDRRLLDHHSHMTVAMERHHGGPVGLRVLAERGRDEPFGDRYAREILLVGPDGFVVQYGIVRIDLTVVGPATAAEILCRAAPLGRILLAAGLLCDVQHVSLVRIEPGPHLCRVVGDTGPLFGRVAEIAVGGRPAIELLEVVVPPTARGPVGG